MAGLNKVVLIGRLGKNPEINHSQQGLAVAKFPIATSEQWTDKNSGERQERTEWHNIVAFGRQAEVCGQYLSKGSQIFIEGKLQTTTYEKEGQTHYITKVVVSNFQFLDSKQERPPSPINRTEDHTPPNTRDTPSNQPTMNRETWEPSMEFNDDIPF